jgi:hypothetical protein
LARDLSLSSPGYLTRTAPWADRAAWTAWAALFATISILILAGSDHSVVSAYRDATRQWFAGGDIYTDGNWLAVRRNRRLRSRHLSTVPAG